MVSLVLAGTVLGCVGGPGEATNPVESPPAGAPDAQCEFSYAQGHGDVFVVFDGRLDWRIRSSFVPGEGETLADPTEVCVVVPAASYALADAMGGAPVSADYAFLDVDPGDSFWLLPQAPREGLPWFGVSTEDVPLAIYTGDEIEFAISAVEIPEGGNASAWSSGTFGAPSLIFATAVGQLTHAFSAGAHVHFNWGFTAPGTYSLLLGVAGRRDGAWEATSPRPLRFVVQP